MVFWRFWQWPDKDRIELTKQRDVIELNLGDAGYEITYKGTATQDPKLLAEYLRRRDHSLEVVIRSWLPAPGSLILYEGTAIVEQTLADKVTIMTASNDSVTLAIDPRSHLPLKKTYSWRDPIDRQFDEEAEIFGNFRMVQGINTAYSTVRMTNGEMSGQRFINNVSYNTGLDPTLFQTKGITYNQPKSGAAQAVDPRGTTIHTLDPASGPSVVHRTEIFRNALFLCTLRVFYTPRGWPPSAHLATCCGRNTTLAVALGLVIY